MRFGASGNALTEVQRAFGHDDRLGPQDVVGVGLTEVAGDEQVLERDLLAITNVDATFEVPSPDRLRELLERAEELLAACAALPALRTVAESKA